MSGSSNSLRALLVRLVPAAALAIVVGCLLAGCGATLNPELERGIPISEPNGALGTGIAPSTVGAATYGSATQAGFSGATAANGGVRLPTGATNLVSVNTPGSIAYKIGPHDVLEITVYKVAELSRTVQVGDTGTINLPLLHDVVASGRTPQELERDLTAKLGANYLQSPQVSVNVREFNSQRVTVEGAVRTPGVYPIKGRTTLLQMMALAGGMDANIASSEVAVFRTRDGKRYAAKFDISEIRTGNAEDPTLVAGDIVVVNTSELKNGFNNFVKTLPLASFLLLL